MSFTPDGVPWRKKNTNIWKLFFGQRDYPVWVEKIKIWNIIF